MLLVTVTEQYTMEEHFFVLGGAVMYNAAMEIKQPIRSKVAPGDGAIFLGLIST